VEIAQIAMTAGFDSFYVDMEHNSFSFDSTGQLCMAGLAIGISPFVRVPSIAPHHISRVLDGGALGVIAPHVHSARDAESVVRAAKFAPLGELSIVGGLPHLQFRTFSAAETIEALNEATMVVIMIESAAVLAEVDEIAAVEGVDLLLIGTNDLCSSLGIPGQLDHEKVRSAYAKAMEACRKHGKHLGVGGLSAYPRLAEEFVKAPATSRRAPIYPSFSAPRLRKQSKCVNSGEMAEPKHRGMTNAECIVESVCHHARIDRTYNGTRALHLPGHPP
jgi:4-hydroxy-2-oxoheptanedioate aldolase